MSRLTKKINRNYEISVNYEEISPEYVITQKLGELEDIEDELCCPLEVVFKALKKGIEYIVVDTIGTESGRKRIEFCSNIGIIGLKYYSLKNYVFLIPNSMFVTQLDYGKADRYDVVYLKDYKKTWWVKGEFQNEILEKEVKERI